MRRRMASLSGSSVGFPLHLEDALLTQPDAGTQLMLIDMHGFFRHEHP
jgi:hypothetical protein